MPRPSLSAAMVAVAAEACASTATGVGASTAGSVAAGFAQPKILSASRTESATSKMRLNMWLFSFFIYKKNHRLPVKLPAAVGRG